jgi:ubiquinol-cytochrome c reductase cytochrome b subunit
VLLLLTFAYGLTGDLLPWDNRAYWGTVVATQIISKVPGVGPYLERLLGGHGPVGVVTFARFYGLHVLLLPSATTFLIGLHVYLVRKHGVAPEPSDEIQPRRKFYPEQVFKDTLAIFAAFAILFVLSIVARVPLESLADPSDASYTPRPECYFLFLFQMLKFFKGPLEVFGSVILPGLAVLALILVPFVDRGKLVRTTRRTVARIAVVLVTAGRAGLTIAAAVTTPKRLLEAEIDFSESTNWLRLSPEELSGIGYFRQENCTCCHPANGDGSGIGPELPSMRSRNPPNG